MRTNLLLILAVTSTCFSLPSSHLAREKILIIKDKSPAQEIISMLSPQMDNLRSPTVTLDKIQEMLMQPNTNLNPLVIDKVLKTLKCANANKVSHNNILTIIDYSLPSSEKRLWVFDLNDRTLLYHTYVSHGIRSGTALSKFFSNKYNSKSSSIGVFKTEKTYHGRDGLSLRLDGLEAGFNDNASNRSVVMHGSWYVDENFIKKYGRAGRSWGCPALPLHLTSALINTIKDDSLFVVYYPSDHWFVKSKFLNCDSLTPASYARSLPAEVKPTEEDLGLRDDVLLASIHVKNQDEPILAVSADDYVRLFNNQAPLERMLRRQIDNQEYIALSNKEFEAIAATNNIEALNAIQFVGASIKMDRGYYKTEMRILDLGKVKDLRFDLASRAYIVDFEKGNSIQLHSTKEFIRWLGL